jgi:2-methylcitrate dehydratase PrpD
MPTISEELAEWSAALLLADIPAEVVRHAKWHSLDTLGCAFAVAAQDYGRKIRAGAMAMGGQGHAHILGFPDRVSPQNAALANGAMASALSFDDTHNATIVHVTATLLAASLALGEERDVTGEEFLVALIAGSELACRTGMAAPLQFHKRGWHPTGLFGAMGAAFAACRLLRLDARATANAIGITGSFAAGIGQGMSEGAEAPNLHAGWGAQAGIAAALLAQHGHTGPAQVFEGEAGLFRTHVQDPACRFDFASVIEALDRRWECLTVSLKPYPCAHVIHAFIDAALVLRARGVRADAVKRVICPIADYMIGVVCEPRDKKVEPVNDWQGRASLQYSVAEALVTGRLDGQSYRGDAETRAAVRALAQKVDYTVDATAKPGQFKGWVIIETSDGKRVEQIEPHNRGSAERPLSEEDIRTKFRANAAPLFGLERLDAIEAEVAALEGPGAVRRLARACVP